MALLDVPEWTSQEALQLNRIDSVHLTALIRFSLIVYRFDRAQPRGRYRNVSYETV